VLRKSPLALALAVAWGIWPLVSPAQQTIPRAGTVGAGQQDAAVVLPDVVAAGQHEVQAERKSAQLQKIVVSEEEVERFGDATVGDVLRRLPGMTFTGPPGVAKDVRMRGLDKGYTQFLINGEPVPGTTHERQMQVDRLPADMIERIEIIRNPTAEYDASGIGGTINIVLKHRADNVTRLRAAYGRNGRMDVGDVLGQWSRRYDNLDVVLGLSYTVGAEDIVEDKDTLNAAGAVTQREHKTKPVKKTETLLTPRLTWTFGQDRLTIDPFISLGTEDKREVSEQRNAAGALSKATVNSEDKTDELGRLSARYDGKAGWGNWYAKLGTQRGKSDKDKNTSEANATGSLTKRGLELENLQEDQSYAGAGAAWPLGPHLLKAGLERRATAYEKRKSVAEAGNATAPLTPKAPGANDIYAIDEARSVLYLQDEWRVANAQWLTLGVRYERTERDATDRNGNTRSGQHASANPSVHYRWAAADNTIVRASVAQTLKLPKFDDVNPLVTLANGANAGTVLNPDKGGNAQLKPERATGIEIGFERFFRDNRGVFGLNLYNRDVRDYVQRAALAEGARFVERPYNVRDARFWGAELDWRVPVLHKGPHELTLTGSHAELRGKIATAPGRSGGQDVKDMPPRVTNIGLDWQHLSSRWSAGFSVSHSPAFGTDSVNPDGVREVKSRNASTLLDLYIRKVFSPTAEVRLVAKNVLAAKKEEAVTKYTATGAFNAAEAKVETSKPTVFVTVESRF